MYICNICDMERLQQLYNIKYITCTSFSAKIKQYRITYLLCYDRKHLQFNSVEFIKACPGSSTGQTLEELAHSKVVKTIRTVEHNTLDSKSLC